MEVRLNGKKKYQKKKSKVLYASIPIEFLKDETLKDENKLLYCIFHSYSSNKDFNKGIRKAWPSHKRIIKDFSWSLSKIKRNQNELEAKNCISVERRKNRSNIVTLNAKAKKK